jgi:hypothetical protein
MRSFRIIPAAAAALALTSTMALAAPSHYGHSMTAEPAGHLYANADHAFGMPTTTPYPRSEMWPPCLQGPPVCTAAGYPNLHYYDEAHGR